MAIFISYRRVDSELVVGPIYDRLISHFPADRVFRDLDSLPIGRPFPQALEEAVAKAKVALIIIGPTWTSIKDRADRRRIDDPADFVRLEVEGALAAGIPVVPVLVRRASMPDPVDLPESIRPLVTLHWVQVRPDPDFHRDMDRLIARLQPLLGSAWDEGESDDLDAELLRFKAWSAGMGYNACFQRSAEGVTLADPSLDNLVEQTQPFLDAFDIQVSLRKELSHPQFVAQRAVPVESKISATLAAKHGEVLRAVFQLGRHIGPTTGVLKQYIADEAFRENLDRQDITVRGLIGAIDEPISFPGLIPDLLSKEWKDIVYLTNEGKQTQELIARINTWRERVRAYFSKVKSGRP